MKSHFHSVEQPIETSLFLHQAEIIALFDDFARIHHEYFF